MDISPQDRDLMIRTVLGEASDQSDTGQAAVAHVILNRAVANQNGANDFGGGTTPSKIVLAPRQFEPWQTRAGELAAYDPNSPAYKRTGAIVDAAASGQIPDPTNGSTYFLDPKIVGNRVKSGQMKWPAWASGQGTVIGGHTFFGGNSTVSGTAAGSTPALSDSDALLELRGGGPQSASPPQPSLPASQPAVPYLDLLNELRGQAPSSTDTGPLRVPSMMEAAADEGWNADSYQHLAELGKAGFQGAKDVINSGATGIGAATDLVTNALRKYGLVSQDTADEAAERSTRLASAIAAENQKFEAEKKTAFSDIGRIGGQIAVTAPLLGAAGSGVGTAFNALTRASPVAARIASTFGPLAQGGEIVPRFVARTAQGAGAGAGAAALTSSASDTPLTDQLAAGALTGGALHGLLGPSVVAGGKYIGNSSRALWDAFTEPGQARLARNALDTFAPGQIRVNASEIVPGSTPTLAEASGDANIATLQRQIRDLNPQPFVAQEAKNSAARGALWSKTIGTPQDVEAAQSALDTQANSAVSTLFRPGQAADTQPVLDTIDGILQGKGGKRDAVQSVLNNVRSKIVNAPEVLNPDGSVKSPAVLESDPEVLYQSVRKQIGDLLDKSADSSAGQQASRELMQVKGALDTAITKAVPGFDQYLSQYSDAARPITAMKYLQGLNLTDAQGNITLAKAQNALRTIEKGLQADGINGAKSLDASHINNLASIRDDLLRQANSDLGRSRGSPTAQNIATQNILQSLLPGRVGHFVSKVDPTLTGAAIGGSLGSMVGGEHGVLGAGMGANVGAYAGHVFQDVMGSKNAAVQSKLESLLINPQSFVPRQQNGGGRQNFPFQHPFTRFAVPAAAPGFNGLLASPPAQEAR
jgi:hypothetical protein